MTGTDAGRLIAALEAGIRELLRTLRTFAAAPAPRAPEMLDELNLDKDELPDSYGQVRVVVLVVDPNLVHAYWEVTPEKLDEARRLTQEPARAVLRFGETDGSFDVDVDLGARNWYVPLWSAGKSYSVDLGLKGADGSFVSLASAGTVRTPPVMPVVQPGERFMRVAGAGQPGEIVAPPPYRKPVRVRAAPEPTVPVPVQTEATSAPELTMPVDSSETLRRKLAELYVLRGWQMEPIKPPDAVVRDPLGSPAEDTCLDLTELAEQRQAIGVSSLLLQDRAPSGNE